MNKKKTGIFLLTAIALLLCMLHKLTKEFVFLVLLILVTIAETVVFFKKDCNEIK